MNSGLGKKIKSIRKEKKLTQKEVATAAGVSEITLRKYEAESVPLKMDTLQKIAKGLEIDLWDLIEEDKKERIKRDKRIYTEILSEAITPNLGIQLIEPFLKKKEIEVVPIGEKQLFLRDFKKAEAIGLTNEEAENLYSKLAGMTLELDELANQLAYILTKHNIDSSD